MTSAIWSTTRFSTRTIAFHALHVTLGKYHHENTVSFHCYVDDTQLYISLLPDETYQFGKTTECIVDIKKNWMTTNFLLEINQVLII